MRKDMRNLSNDERFCSIPNKIHKIIRVFLLVEFYQHSVIKVTFSYLHSPKTDFLRERISKCGIQFRRWNCQQIFVNSNASEGEERIISRYNDFTEQMKLTNLIGNS